MIGIDTNILVRFLVKDDPAQNLAALRFLEARTAESPAYVSAIVLAETAWILNRRLKYPTPVVTKLLQDLLATESLVFEYIEELDALLSEESPKADLADYLIAWAAQRAGCHTTKTFDQKAASRVPGMELLA